MAGTELELLGACGILLRHTKWHYALMLAKMGREISWAAWRAVLSPRIAPHEEGSCTSGLLAPLHVASALDPDSAVHLGQLTLLKIQLAMGRPLGPRRGGGARLMKAVAGLQVLTSSGGNESAAHCQLRKGTPIVGHGGHVTYRHLSSAVSWRGCRLVLTPFVNDSSADAAPHPQPRRPESLLAQRHFPFDLTENVLKPRYRCCA